MQLKLSLIVILGTFNLALATEIDTNEECLGYGVIVPVFMECKNCSSMNLHICGGGENGTMTTYLVNCPEGTYCSQEGTESAICVEQLPSGCETAAPPPEPSNPLPSLICTGLGIYPDPSDCKGFHYCTEYGQSSEFQPCPEDYSFDPEFTSTPCKKTVNETVDCLKVDCSESSVFKSYGGSSQFYAYCREGANTNETVVSMFRCADRTSFDGSQCVFQCPGEGNFANALNEYNYYQCYYSGEELVNRLLPCPGSRKFNETMQICL